MAAPTAAVIADAEAAAGVVAAARYALVVTGVVCAAEPSAAARPTARGGLQSRG